MQLTIGILKKIYITLQWTNLYLVIKKLSMHLKFIF